MKVRIEKTERKGTAKSLKSLLAKSTLVVSNNDGYWAAYLEFTNENDKIQKFFIMDNENSRHNELFNVKFCNGFHHAHLVLGSRAEGDAIFRNIKTTDSCKRFYEEFITKVYDLISEQIEKESKEDEKILFDINFKKNGV